MTCRLFGRLYKDRFICKCSCSSKYYLHGDRLFKTSSVLSTGWCICSVSLHVNNSRDIKSLTVCLRNWSRSGGSYGNNARAICCPAPGRPESAARGSSPPGNKSRGCCCRNSRPTVINPNYNMTKQRYITYIYDKIRSKSPPNRATSPTRPHCDVTHLSLTTGVVALHIPSRRVGVREEHCQARKTVWPVNAGRVICRYQNNLCGIINHHKRIWERFCDV